MKFIKLYSNEGTQWNPIVNFTDLKITKEINTLDTIEFKVPLSDDRIPYIETEGYVRVSDGKFVIKEVTKKDDGVEVYGIADIEDLNSKRVYSYSIKDASVVSAFNLALSYLTNSSWILINKSTITRKRSMKLKKMSVYEIIQKLIDLYFVEVRFDTINKYIYLYNSKGMGVDNGCRFMENINLESLEVKEDTSDFATILYAYGKDDLNFSSINDGKTYVTNYTWSKKKIVKTWTDNRYANKEYLLEDAKLKLAECATPFFSYTATIKDLSKMIDNNNVFKFNLGDTITIYSKTKDVKIKQRVIKYVKYPCEPEKNTVELANRTRTLEQKQATYRKFVEAAQTAYDSDNTVSNVSDNAVGSSTIKNGAVNSDKISNGAIKSVHIDEAQIKSAHIGNAEIKSANIGNAQIKSAHIDEAQIDTAHIKDAAITSAKINFLSADKIITGTLDASKVNVTNLNANNITSGTIDANKIEVKNLSANNIDTTELKAAIINAGALTSDSVKSITIDASQITSGEIDATNINIKNINGNHIADGTILAEALANEVITNLQGTTVYYTATEPTGDIKEGSLWYKTVIGKNEVVNVFVYENNAWIEKKLDAQAFVANSITSREISSEYIYSGNIYADQITVSSDTTKNTLSGFTISDDAIYRNHSGLGAPGNGNIYLGVNGFSLSDKMIYSSADDQLRFGNDVKVTWGNISDPPTIPTDISDLNNDAGYITADDVPDMPTDEYITTISRNSITSEVIKGWNLEVGNQVKMGENAVISWNNISSKPTIPTNISQLANDAGFQNYAGVVQITRDTIDAPFIRALKLKVGTDIEMSENAVIKWSNISDSPTIPTNTSQLTNDSGFATTTYVNNAISGVSGITLPSYITSTKITSTTIESPAISGGTILSSKIQTDKLYIQKSGYVYDTDESENVRFIYMVGDLTSDTKLRMGRVSLNNYSKLYNSIDFEDSSQVRTITLNTDIVYAQTLAPVNIAFDGNIYNAAEPSAALTLKASAVNSGKNTAGFFRPIKDADTSFKNGIMYLGGASYKWKAIYCATGSILTSDRNLKTNITDLDSKYLDLFDRLQPVQYKLINGDRIHTGFIAQDVEASMTEVGLTTEDFGGFCKDLKENSTDEYIYGLRYEEFIAINTAKIKQLEQKINELEAIINTQME